MKYVFFFVFVCLLLVGAFVGSNFSSIVAINFPQFNSDPEPKQELTTEQVSKMIELNIIQVYPEQSHEDNDKRIGLVYQTQNGECEIYQNFLGRYYCRW